MIRISVVEPNIKKSKRKPSLYRDGKSTTHRTVKGVGIIGRLIKKKSC